MENGRWNEEYISCSTLKGRRVIVGRDCKFQNCGGGLKGRTGKGIYPPGRRQENYIHLLLKVTKNAKSERGNSE
jgi:hypothetical protein